MKVFFFLVLLYGGGFGWVWGMHAMGAPPWFIVGLAAAFWAAFFLSCSFYRGIEDQLGDIRERLPPRR